MKKSELRQMIREELNSSKLNEENIFDSLQKLTDAFFDGLTDNAINSALEKAKKHPEVPSPVLKHMIAIDKASRDLKKMIKELE